MNLVSVIPVFEEQIGNGMTTFDEKDIDAAQRMFIRFVKEITTIELTEEDYSDILDDGYFSNHVESVSIVHHSLRSVT
jgi:hypothetical protein